jgi:hypothetical protein
MFQFQGSISDADKETIVSELQKWRHIVVSETAVFNTQTSRQIVERESR